MAAFRRVALMNAALLACASLALAGAAPTSRQVIGVVMTSVPGEALTVNGLGAVGNASLTEGARVEAGSVPAQIRLSSGVRATVEAGSRAQVFADHIVVEQGSATTSAKSYSVQTPAVSAKAASASSTPAPGAVKSAAQAGKPGAPNGAAGVKPGSGLPSLPAVGSSWFSGDDHQGGFGNHGGSGGGQGGFGDGHDGDHDGGHGNGGDHDGDHGGGHDGDHDHDHDGHHHHHHHGPPPVSRP